MADNSGNGRITLDVGGQSLYWSTVANVFTSDPVDADGVRLTGGDLTAVTVVAGDLVVDDAVYWTFGEGPVSVILVNAFGETIYSGTPWFDAPGRTVQVHPSDAQIETGLARDAAATAELADSAVTTGKIANGTIVDADVNATAAIAGTKLADVHLRNRVTFDGANGGATIAATTRYLANTTALTVSRAVVLPAANGVAAGTEIVVADESGSCTAVATIVVTRAGSDNIQGSTTWTINRAYGAVRLVSNGVSRWVVVAAYNLLADADISATAAISASKLNGVHLRARGTFSNIAYQVVSTDRYVAQTGTMDASRAATLPLASALSPGEQITIADESGTVTATNTIVVTRNTADTINGGTTATIAHAYGSVTLVSDGATKWTLLESQKLTKPATPTAITGDRSDDYVAILGSLLSALSTLGLIADSTTA